MPEISVVLDVYHFLMRCETPGLLFLYRSLTVGLDTVPQLLMAPKTEVRFFETYVMRLSKSLLERRAQQHTGGERTKKRGLLVYSIGGQNMETSGQLQQQRSAIVDLLKFFCLEADIKYTTI